MQTKSAKRGEKKKGQTETIEIPEGINASIEDGFVVVKGSKSENKKYLNNKKVKIKIDQNQITLFSEKLTKREKKIVGTFKAHIKNMIEGVQIPYKYVLKICSGHFPINVSVDKNKLIVKNFLGEKVPRVIDIIEGVDVKVEGDCVVVESPDKEKAGRCAASIEQLTKRKGYDTRIFQDGLWISQKPATK